jgi:radical SAM protein with 4Fe4S-binding SPASM domain
LAHHPKSFRLFEYKKIVMPLALTHKFQREDSIFWKKLVERDIPYSFWIEITARCNNNCRHCFVNSGRGENEKEISDQEILKVADEAASMGCLNCTVTGGEPLMRDDFANIYTYLKRKGFLITLFTNATLITEDILELFSKYPPREVQVSLYGSTKETYETVTQCNGSFDAFAKGLELLQSIGTKIRLKAVAMRSNLHEMPDMARFAIQRTGKPLTFDPILIMRRDGDPAKNGIIASERILPQEIELLETCYCETMRIEEKGCNKPIGQLRCGRSIFSCISDTRSFFISSDGRMQRCPTLSHQRLTADLGEMSLRDFLKGFGQRVEEEFGKRRSRSNCDECHLVDLCSFCPSWDLLEMGNPTGRRNYFCQVAQNRARYKR